MDKIGYKPKKVVNQYKLPILQKHNSDDAIDSIEFDKCKLSIRSPTTPSCNMEINNENNKENVDKNEIITKETEEDNNLDKANINNIMDIDSPDRICKDNIAPVIERKDSIDVAPDIVRGVENYSEDELVNHKVKLEELQLRQKLMEEQNKKRKEMLARALADRYVIMMLYEYFSTHL